MAFEPATVSPLRIQKSNSTASANSAASHYSDHSQSQSQQQSHDMRPKTPLFDHVSHNQFLDIDSSELGTPESVIHYSFEDDAPGTDSIFDESSFMPEPSFVPRRFATIKAPDGGLKTRTSATVAELVALKDITQSTNEGSPSVSTTASALRRLDDENEEIGKAITNDDVQKAKFDRRKSFRMKLDMPSLNEHESELSFGMNKEFDRLLGASKRGYHMRENDDVVVASTRNFSNENEPPEATENAPAPVKNDGKTLAPRETKSAGNSPRKASGPVTKEPWNGRMRRQSTRRSMAPERKAATAGPAAALDTIEDQSFVDDTESGTDRGRFFVKVVGVKELSIPLPRNETCRFQLTLDNGLHCVTTNTIELGRNAPIGQEFELTVFDELDFTLTLQTKLERPVSKGSTTSADESFGSPFKAKAAKQSALSRFLSSPKKKKREEEMRLEAEAEAARQRKEFLQQSRRSTEPSAWDLLHNLVGEDGSFAEAVVSLDDHESKAFGRPYTVDVPCFNNWAVEENALANSTKSKHGGVQRKPPHKVGMLSLQMIFVPRPKGVKEEDMPTSMSACVKQMKEAEAATGKEHEGFLSQQGGDCPFWRRRFFRLNGSNLTSYHETTRQRRANINLTKATKLIDDKSSLTSSTESGQGKKRRKSAFAADEEGYMFVEEGFRIRFANGETIDFYADNRQQKDEWMTVLSQVLGRETGAQKPTWTSAVLAREKTEGTKSPVKASPAKARPAVPAKDASPTRAGARNGASSPTRAGARSGASSPTRASPAKPARPQTTFFEKRPASPTKHKAEPSPKRTSGSGIPSSRTSGVTSSRRQAVKSMIF